MSENTTSFEYQRVSALVSTPSGWPFSKYRSGNTCMSEPCRNGERTVSAQSKLLRRKQTPPLRGASCSVLKSVMNKLHHLVPCLLNPVSPVDRYFTTLTPCCCHCFQKFVWGFAALAMVRCDLFMQLMFFNIGMSTEVFLATAEQMAHSAR